MAFLLQINGNEHEPERVVEKSDIRQSSSGISQYRQIMKYKVEGQILFS